jgi:amidohydrolase
MKLFLPCLNAVKAASVLALWMMIAVAHVGVHAQSSQTLVSASPLASEIDKRAQAMEQTMLGWRRDFHQNPELGNREFRTAKIVAEHLTKLGFEVKTGVAKTGVVGVLKGAKAGPVVALRADMDALPVGEQVALPFASKARTQYNGQEVGVMHACGHDAHVAILMSVAEILAGLKDKLPGTVKVIFQPAEEGPPEGEEGGAELMLKEGAFENPKPDVVFGLHVFAGLESGKITWRPGATMAAVDYLRILLKGRQTHGAKPWGGVDPIVLGSQVVLGLQTIESRQVNVTKEPSIITVGTMHGGVRNNIIPDSVEMTGTIRTFDPQMQNEIHERIKRTSELIAQSGGGSANVMIRRQYPMTYNHERLADYIAPTLKRVASEENTAIADKQTGAEDFAFYQQRVPGFFFFLGITPKGTDAAKAASNHSPLFFIDEPALVLGVKALANIASDYLHKPAPAALLQSGREMKASK